MVLAAVTQMTSSGNILANLSVCQSLIQRAAAAGAKAVFLPEAADFIAPGDQVPKLTYSKEAAQFVRGIQTSAKENKVFVSVCVHEPADEAQRKKDEEENRVKQGNRAARCWNTQLLIDGLGEIKARYRKTHLFDVDIKGGITIKESDTTIPGSRLEAPVESPLGKLGPLTCYDLRFPEASLHLRRLGAQVILYPSAFSVRTGVHWDVLLRARAIETQSYVIAAAQVGTHPGTQRTSWGHALVVDPWGTIVTQCSDMQPYKPTFSLADIVSSTLPKQTAVICLRYFFLTKAWDLASQIVFSLSLSFLSSQDLTNIDSLRREMPLWEQRRNRDHLYPEI